MAQVQSTSLHNFVNGETVMDVMLDQNFETLRVALNDADSKSNSNATAIATKANQSDFTALQTTVTANGVTLAAKADKTYVDTQISNIQNGQIADNSVSTQKIVDKAVTGAKIADGTITDRTIDTTTVPTNATMSTAISNAVSAAQTTLQGEIDANGRSITTNATAIASVQTQVNNLQYNKDLTSAQLDILALSFAVTNLQNATVQGMTGNIVVESFKDMNDWTITAGVFDSTNRRFYLP